MTAENIRAHAIARWKSFWKFFHSKSFRDEPNFDSGWKQQPSEIFRQRRSFGKCASPRIFWETTASRSVHNRKRRFDPQARAMPLGHCTFLLFCRPKRPWPFFARKDLRPLFCPVSFDKRTCCNCMCARQFVSFLQRESKYHHVTKNATALHPRWWSLVWINDQFILS